MTAKRRLKAVLDKTGLLPAARALKPRYRGPMRRLALARAKALLAPGDASRHELARAYSELGRVQLESDLPGDAVSNCETALSLWKDCATAYAVRGAARRLRGDAERAVQDCRDALNAGAMAAPLRARCLMTVAASVMREIDDRAKLEEAARLHDEALALDPTHPDYFWQAGLAHRYLGQYAQAEALWARGLLVQAAAGRRKGLDALGVRFLGESWLGSVGHVGAIDYYVKLGILGLRPPQRTVAVPPAAGAHNAFQLKQWSAHVEFTEDLSPWSLAKEDKDLLTDELWAARFPDGSSRWYVPAAIRVQKQWEAEGRAPLLKLSDEDRRRGRARLNELGVPQGAWFVSLHVREAAFWKDLDRAHPTARDADIISYLPAIRKITERGGWVIRMGDSGMKPLPKMDRVVDYARSPLKADWMDVFLWAECRFYLGTCSGAANVPPTYGVPCALTNWPLMGAPLWYRDIVYLPKLFRRAGQTRFLPASELFAAGLGMQDYRGSFSRGAIEIVDNSPEELAEVAEEMLERAEGRADYSKEDDALQARFSAAIEAQDGYVCGRIGRGFLRRHGEALAGKTA